MISHSADCRYSVFRADPRDLNPIFFAILSRGRYPDPNLYAHVFKTTAGYILFG